MRGLIAWLGLCVASGVAADLIVVSPDGPLPSVVTTELQDDKDAAADFCRYLSRVSGRQIAVTDTPAATGVILHVGADAFAKAHAPAIADLYADGFLIKTVPDEGREHVILAGPHPASSRWATERFPIDYCGVRWLFPDPAYGEVVPSRPTLTLPATLDRRHEPDYRGRANCGMYMFSPARKYLRLGPSGGPFGSHELQFMFSTEEFAAHPEWFAFFKGKRQWWKYGNGWQICTTNPGTVQRAVDYIDAYFARDPTAYVASVGQNDGNGWCECEACTAFVKSFDPPYTYSERWFHWVNQVAREVAKKHPGKWVEAMAYASTSDPPRFQLADNVATTKTFVLDSEYELAEQWMKVCKSVNLYSYMYGNSFMGFRHYPHAAQEVLKWGHDKLGAIAHVVEGGGDWTFDGPKYHYIQALQWDVNADVDAIMQDFCDSSYGRAAVPMRDFWDRLEAVYDRRPPTPYGEKRKRWLFYQWVTWAMSPYLQPNDEFASYNRTDVAHLDTRIAEAERLAAADTATVQFRVARIADAWRYYRTMVVSCLRYYPIVAAAEVPPAEALPLAREIATVRADRMHYMQKMRQYPHINPRLTGVNFWSWGEALTFFSHETTLIDALCTAISERQGAAAPTYWRRIDDGDVLHAYARTQLQLLERGTTENLLVNGGFESGDLDGWEVVSGTAAIVGNDVHGGGHAVSLQQSGNNTLTQRVAVAAEARYRLSAWARHRTQPPATAAPLETIMEFYSGAARIWSGPTRAVWRTTDPAAGWVQMQTTLTAPPGADAVLIKLTRRANFTHLWDDIRFERISDGPKVTPGILDDRFDGDRVDGRTWIEATEHRNSAQPPAVDSGWLVFTHTDGYPLTSRASFNDLLAYDGDQRYRLRFRAKTLDGLPPADTMFSLGIKSGTGTISTKQTGMFWYFYFSSKKRQEAMLSAFHFQSGTRTGGPSLALRHLPQPVTDVWYTLRFGPQQVAIYAAAGGYDERPASLVGTCDHGITDLTADGAVYLKLGSGGNYRLDEISLQRPDAAAPAAVQQPAAPSKDDPKRLIMPGVTD